MRSKGLSAILAAFLFVLVAFFAVQIINILTQKPLPKTANVSVNQINPTIDQSIFSNLKGK